MVRTQVYLTDEERDGLAVLSRVTGKRQSRLIREALDDLIGRSGRKRRDAVLDRAAGIWKGRRDLPDFRAIRREWDGR
jgi:hypothetical protein